MQDDFSSISSALYQSYFEQDSTPSNLVSSHWVKMHEKTVVNNSQGKGATGFGFGHFPQQSLVGKFFSWATIIAHLNVFPEGADIAGLFARAWKLAKRIGHPFTFDMYRQVCTYALLKPYLKGNRFLIIGDGIGFLSAFIKESDPEAKITLVDLGKTLFFQVGTIQQAHGNASCSLAVEDRYGTDVVELDTDFVFCPTESLCFIEKNVFDVAININSMQEMNVETVSMYFDFIRRQLSEEGLFYCSNRVEKVMPSGEVSRFADYPWQEQDEHLVDEMCPWSAFFFDRSTLPSGPTCLGMRIPFVSYYDGPTRHRLSRLVACGDTT